MDTISDMLHTFLMELPQEVMLAVMLEAMDEMQYHNNRSMTECIFLALGVQKQTSNTGASKYNYPTHEFVLQRFSHVETSA